MEGDADCLCPRRWHPHFSALVDGGFLMPEKLDVIRASVARIQGVPLARVNVYYQYGEEPMKKLHWVNYVCRPTFLDWRWDEEMAVRLMGFRTYQAWGQGKWDDGPAWEIPMDHVDVPPEPVQALAKGSCPLDGTNVTWRSDVVEFTKVSAEAGWYDLGGGYWGSAAMVPKERWRRC